MSAYDKYTVILLISLASSVSVFASLSESRGLRWLVAFAFFGIALACDFARGR